MIPFNKPFRATNELEYVTEALASGLLSGDGPFTKRASELLSQLVGGGDVLLTTSCTHALEMAALLLNLGPGDEVIMPSFTFVSCANAISLRGATPIFVDARSDTFNIDETKVAEAITERTKAILVVHYAGVAVNFDEILRIANENNLKVIEDNAHGLGGTYKGRPLGSFGTLATQSFHVTKNISCGEGGALVINDPTLVERAEIIREKGTNRSQFFRGMVDKYRWVDIGSSYLPSDILAAILTSQLEEFESIQARRTRIWERYREELSPWAEKNGIRMQAIPSDTTHPAHLFALLMPTSSDQSGFIEHLKKRGVMAVFHYQPLHKGFGASNSQKPCLVSDDIAQRLVRLPFFSGLTDAELEHIIRASIEYSNN